MKAIIVDDEPKARTLLNTLLKEYCAEVDVIGFSDNTDEAAVLIKRLKPDVVFLDIEMKGESGFDLLTKVDLGDNIKIVFVTAFKEYAIEALKKGGFDYILKPVDVDEIISCIEKIKQHKAKNTSALIEEKTSIYIKGEIKYLKQKDILFIKADGRYSSIQMLDGKQYMQTKNLGLYETELNSSLFKRVHKSYLVNMQHVSGINKAKRVLKMKGDFEIPMPKKMDLEV